MPLQLGGLRSEGQSSSHFDELLSSSQPRVWGGGQLWVCGAHADYSLTLGDTAVSWSLYAEGLKTPDNPHLQQVCPALPHHSPSRLRSAGRSGLAVPGLFRSPPVAGQSHIVHAPIGRRWPCPARQVVRPALWLLGRGRAAPRGLAQVAAPGSPHWPQVPPAPWIGPLDGQVPPLPSVPPAPRTAQVPRSWRGGCRRSRAARSLPRSAVCPAWQPGPSPGPLAMAGAPWKQR